MEEKPNPYKWPITITVMIATIMSALDMSIVNVAMPHIQGTLGASVEEIAWVSTGYILSSVVLMPITALISSRFGRKRFYIAAVLLFTGASMMCGMAWDLRSMVIFRMIQGIGGGALIPIAQAILRETYLPHEQAMAMSIYGLGIILGPAIGPTLGGWLTDNYSWPWIFYINVPVGIINILMIMKFIKDPPYLIREKGHLDLAGLLFLIAGLGALQIMLEKGNQKDWFSSDFIFSLAIIAAMGLILFIWRELTTEHPAVNLKILRDINFSSATFLGGILGMGLMGSLFLVPLLLQELLQYTAFETGLALLPRSIAMAVAMPIGGRIYNKLGPRIMVGSGLIMNSISFYQLSCLSLDVGYWDLFFPQFLQGIGFGFIFVSLSTAALASIDKRLMTAATGLYNVTRQVFGSIGIALSATLLTQGINSYRALLIKNITYSRGIIRETLQGLAWMLNLRGADPGNIPVMSMKMLDGMVMQQSVMLAYNHVFFLTALVFLFALPLLILVKDAQLSGGVAPSH